MKIMHLSDLHIGKQIYEQSLIEDQKYILNQILQIIKQENVSVLMLCGDIYDRAIPPSEAVLVFDYFLTELKQNGPLNNVTINNVENSTLTVVELGGELP